MGQNAVQTAKNTVKGGQNGVKRGQNGLKGVKIAAKWVPRLQKCLTIEFFLTRKVTVPLPNRVSTQNLCLIEASLVNSNETPTKIYNGAQQRASGPEIQEHGGGLWFKHCESGERFRKQTPKSDQRTGRKQPKVNYFSRTFLTRL